MLEKYLQFFKHHERMIIVLLVLVVGGWLGNHYLNNSAADAHDKAAILQYELEQQKATTAQVTQEYKTMVDTLSKQNATLASAVASRNNVLVEQQKKDQTLPLPELAVRWKNLSGLDDNEIEAVNTSGVFVTDSGARKTVVELEQIPVLTSNLKDTQDIVVNKQKEIDKANAVITEKDKTIAKTDESCKAQIDSVKKDARKGKVKWFKVGFVTGFVAGIFTGHTIP